MITICTFYTRTILGIALIICFQKNIAHAQTRYFVVSEDLQKVSKLPKKKLDSAEIIVWQNKMVRKVRFKGYWLANIDSTLFKSDTAICNFYVGNKFDHVEINTDNFPEEALDHFDSRKNVSNEPKLYERIDNTLVNLENNGYPFSRIVIDSASFDNEILKLKLNIDLGSLIKYDSLSVTPNNLVKASFLSNYLRIHYDNTYSQTTINNIPSKLNRLSYLELIDAKTTFRLSKSKTKLSLKPRKVNTFDGIIGAAPNSNQKGVNVTGQVNLSLKNVLKTGKQIDLFWQKLNPEVQKLNVKYIHPVIFGSPLNFYFEIDQLRQDSLYANRSLLFAVDYIFRSKTSWRISYENILGNQLIDESNLSSDFKLDYYGINFNYNNLDNIILPKKGINIQASAQVGLKNISSSMDNTSTENQYRFKLDNEIYWNLNLKSVLFSRISLATVFGDQIFLNDLFRLGGIKSIRGFNEGEFFAANYALINTEFRLFIDDKSFLMMFYDHSFLQYDLISSSFSDSPSGVGIGMNFTDSRGNFLLIYGIGKRNNQPYSFNESKLHFGYSVLF